MIHLARSPVLPRPTRAAARAGAWVLVCGAAALPASFADILILRSGERMECVVVRETDRQVTVDIGMGEMSLPRGKVAEIIREPSAANDARRATWEKQYAPPPPLPEAWRELSQAYNRLGSQRNEAIKVSRAAARDRKRLEQLRRQEATEAARFNQLSREMAEEEATRDRRRYRELVEDYNQSVAVLNVNRTEQAELAMRRERGATATQDYLKSLALVSALYREQTEHLDRPELEEHVAAWLGTVERRLEAWGEDFARFQVHVQRQGGSLVVSALVNGRGTGTFVVDTGASLVTLSTAAAERLGVRYRNGPTLRMTLADGSEREGRGVTLQSLAVGDAREANVAAVVMDDPPAGGVDGLLGMSFLGKFMMSLDGASSDLVLRRFEPK